MKFQSPKKKEKETPTTIATRTRRKNKWVYDRHIRKIDNERYSLHSASPSSVRSTSSYHSELQESLLKNKPVRQYTLDKRTNENNCKEVNTVKTKRVCHPVRKFKVPGWSDNYYSNLLDWSHNNFICAANHHQLFFYNMAMQDQFENSLYRQYTVRSGTEHINAIHFSPTNTKIALGYTQGTLKCYDYFKERTSNSLIAHSLRITTIQCYDNCIYTGSKDKKVYAFDARTMQNVRHIHQDHEQEVCGVKAYASYLATGGNDNNVFIYDIRKTEHYLSTYSHEAAVKALDWVVPNVLVSGGGTTDRKMKFWKDGCGITKEIDTGSQVCGLIASTNSAQIVSCQGFSLNQIIIWNMQGRRELTVHGHMKRVLYCALGPGGRFVATGAGDQVVNIWKFFDGCWDKDWPITDIR